jgi:hypothetical protein
MTDSHEPRAITRHEISAAPAIEDASLIHPRSTPRCVVLPANRNGYSTVLGQIVGLVARAPASPSWRGPTVLVPSSHEQLLRDADAVQIGAAGVVLARTGPKAEWRVFLRDHFKRKYGLALVFEALELAVE